MNGMKMVAIALLVFGIVGLAYGGFTYTQETHHADLGSLHMSISDKKTVNIPVWAGAGAIVVGGLLLVVPKKRS